jgi:hypothetical protein
MLTGHKFAAGEAVNGGVGVLVSSGQRKQTHSNRDTNGESNYGSDARNWSPVLALASSPAVASSGRVTKMS